MSLQNFYRNELVVFVLSLYTHPHENLFLEHSLLLFQVVVLRSHEMRNAYIQVHSILTILISSNILYMYIIEITILLVWCYFHLGLSKIGSGKYILVVQYLPLCFCWSAVHFFCFNVELVVLSACSTAFCHGSLFLRKTLRPS